MDGGQTTGSIITYEITDDGKLINQETGEEYVPGVTPDSETLPQSLWDQHNAPPPRENDDA